MSGSGPTGTSVGSSVTGEATDRPEGGGAPSGSRASVRAVLGWLGLVGLLISAVVASNVFSIRDRMFGSLTPEPAPAAASRDAGAPSLATTVPATALRSQPWWQNVTTREGSGTAAASPFTIDTSAIQWRVKWRCQSGRLVVRDPRRAKPVVDGACPEGAVGYAIQTGMISLEVIADGPWRLDIAQQIEAPLVEPPLPAMTAAGAVAVATGPFYKIDKTGTGTVTVYRQADGRYSLRLENFFVSPNSDLELRLSPLAIPRSSEEFLAAPSELVAVMDVTAGSLNFAVPAGIDPTRFRSVVIWCPPVNSAYAAASLGAPR